MQFTAAVHGRADHPAAARKILAHRTWYNAALEFSYDDPPEHESERQRFTRCRCTA
jgi:hypothetical protein